jgi:hypothetical protein
MTVVVRYLDWRHLHAQVGHVTRTHGASFLSRIRAYRAGSESRPQTPPSGIGDHDAARAARNLRMVYGLPHRVSQTR